MNKHQLTRLSLMEKTSNSELRLLTDHDVSNKVIKRRGSSILKQIFDENDKLI